MTLQNSFNIHYQFNDVGHYMDAFIFNKCEYQLFYLTDLLLLQL